MLGNVYRRKISIMKNCLNFAARTLLILIFLTTRQFGIDEGDLNLNSANVVLLLCLFMSPVLIFISEILRIIISYFLSKIKQ